MAGILTITLNPAIDVYTSVDKLLPSAKLRCAPERRDAGGGGINVARVAQRLGASVAAAHTSAGIVGKLLERLLADEGLETVVLPVSGETREDMTVLERATGREYRFVLPGPTLSGDDWQASLAKFSSLEHDCGLVVLSGSAPPGAPADAYAQLARSAKATGARVIVDASGEPLRTALKEGVFLVKPSLEEMRSLLDSPLPDEKSWVAAAQDLVGKGSEIVVLSLGAGGAVLATKDYIWRAEGPRVEVVSSIGAGDSLVGALTWAICTGLPLDEALRYGVAAGSATLLAAGTQLCSREDVMRLLPGVRVSRL